MPSPRFFLLALVVLLALGNLWATFHRSGIPVELTGRVERIEGRREKHPGLDDVHLVTVAGREIHLDPAVASLLREGDDIRKAAWSTDLQSPRGSSRLEVSRDFVRMVLSMPLLAVLAWVLLRRRWGCCKGESL